MINNVDKNVALFCDRFGISKARLFNSWVLVTEDGKRLLTSPDDPFKPWFTENKQLANFHAKEIPGAIVVSLSDAIKLLIAHVRDVNEREARGELKLN